MQGNITFSFLSQEGFDFGVIRPIKGWDKKGLDEFNPFERKEEHGNGARTCTAAHTAPAKE